MTMKHEKRVELLYAAKLVTDIQMLGRFMNYCIQNGYYSSRTATYDIVSRCAKTFCRETDYWAEVNAMDYDKLRSECRIALRCYAGNFNRPLK